MDPATLLADYGPYAGVAVYCFLGGLIPLFNVEAFLILLAAGTETGRHWLVLSVLTASAHMGAKSLLYAGGRGLGVGLGRRGRAGVQEIDKRLQRWRYGTSAFVFTSAAVGLPPFYAVSVLAGTVRFSFPRFILAGFAGRFVRFAALLLFPQAAIRLLHAI